MAIERRFHWADYLVFAASLLLSSFIGIYYNIRDRKKSSTSEYLMGGRDMSILPVAASMVVSLVSAIFVQGAPAEIYAYGIYGLVSLWGYPIALLLSFTFYMPVFHRLGVTSAFEYLELRYNRTIRVVCSGLSMIQMICYSSVALYAPTIAISQATGLPIWSCILITALICTFYTTLGGYKTVLWTDTLQCGIMFVGLTATMFKGAAEAGGFGQVFNISRIGERMSLKNVVPDPRLRHTVWDAVCGDIPFFMAMYAISQFAVQRFCSIRSVNRARIAMACAIPIMVALMILATLTGLVAFAYYYGCDPLESGRIKSRDQTLSILVMDVFKDNPGMAGVFLSSILSAALSTLSSVQNSFAAILLEDFLKPVYQRVRGRPIGDRPATILSKVVVFLVGATITCLALVASKSGKLVILLASSTLALGSAPILGLFTMGLLFPFGNSKGALAGLVSGVLLLGWIVAGSLSTPKTLHKPLPTSVDHCPVEFVMSDQLNGTYNGNFSWVGMNFTTEDGYDVINTTKSSSDIMTGGLSDLYRVSFAWYGLIGSASSLIVGLAVSLLTNGWKTRHQVKEGVLFSWKLHGYWCCAENKEEDDAHMKELKTNLMPSLNNVENESEKKRDMI